MLRLGGDLLRMDLVQGTPSVGSSYSINQSKGEKIAQDPVPLLAS